MDSKRALQLAVSGVALSVPILYFLYQKSKTIDEEELIYAIARKAEKNIRSLLRQSTTDLEELEHEIEEISKNVLHLAKSQDRHLPRQYWFGKAVQRCLYLSQQLEKHKDTPEIGLLNELILELDSLIKLQSSSVSPKVALLITTSQIQFPKSFDTNYILDDGTLDWSKLALPPDSLQRRPWLKGKPDPIETKCYEDQSLLIKKASLQIHNYLLSLTLDEFNTKYSSKFAILGEDEKVKNDTSSESFRKLLPELFMMQKQGHSILVFLRASSLLDHALGDALFILTKGKQIIPRKMRLTIAKPELQKYLGDVAILVLLTLIGPIDGINLRNLLWHGFLKPEEFETHFTSFLLMTILSLDKINDLLHKNKDKRRPLNNATIFDTSLTFAGAPLYIFDKLNREDIDCLFNIFDNSFFIMPGHLPFWTQAIDWYLNGNYVNALILLFPQIEHSLRRVFVCVNDCSDRLWTAETEVLYSTLDILLNEKVFETEQDNHLYKELGNKRKMAGNKNKGPHFMECLLDTFIWFEGPKIRDQISHGAVDTSTISEALTQRVLALAFSLCIKYDVRNHNKVFVKQLTPNLQKCWNFVENYRSCFHLKAIVQREMRSTFVAWSKYCHLQPYPNLPPETRFDIAKAEKFIEPKVEYMKNYIIKNFNLPLFNDPTIDMSAEWEKNVLPTLLCTNEEIQQVAVIRQLNAACKEACEMLISEHARMDKLLKSRKATSDQRKNFFNFFLYLKYYEYSITLMLYTAEVGLRSPWKPDPEYTEYLRSCQHCVEKMLGCMRQHLWKKTAVVMSMFLGETEQDPELANIEKKFWNKFKLP